MINKFVINPDLGGQQGQIRPNMSAVEDQILELKEKLEAKKAA